MDETSGSTAVAESSESLNQSAPADTPATPAPSVSTSQVDRPRSFAEALTRAAATAPAPPAPSATGVTSLTAATVQSPPPVSAEPELKGPIPFDRHESALKNARAKTETEVVQRFQQQYAPHVELGQRIQQDPVGTVTQLLTELANHPDYAAQIRSLLGGTESHSPAVDQEPQADLQTTDGTLVFSAEQLARREAYQRAQVMAEVDQRISPFQQREQTLLAQERLQGEMRQAHDRMSRVLAPYQQMPEFREHQPAIAAKAQALMADGFDAQTALGLAVSTVLRETVLPRQTAQSQDQLRAEAVAKSIGSTSAAGSAPSAPGGRPKTFAAAFRRMSA